MNENHSKLNTCNQMQHGNTSRTHSCAYTGNELKEPGMYNDEKLLEQLEMESHAELEKARKMLRKTERAVKHCRKASPEPARRPVQKPPSPKTPCRPAPINDSRDAIKRLVKVPVRNEYECRDGKIKGRSIGKVIPPSCILPPSCTLEMPEERDMRELPRKPKLTSEELNELLDQEAKDVESAWFLTSETKGLYKKPCPKQQQARDAVRALVEPKKEEPEPLPPAIPKEPLPFLDPDPDDISPEVAANMMFTQERGIKMICCPEETVRHLFADKLGPQGPEGKKGGEGQDEILDNDLDESAEVDDSVFTRNMGQRESGSRHFQPSNTSYDRKAEFVLQEKETKCVNKVQLRGNCPPWFPGYFFAFPDQGGDVQVAKSPSGVFQRAWLAAKPNCVPSSDLYLVE